MLYEKLTAEKRKELRTESKQRFEKIYQKTLEAFDLTPEEAPCSRGFQKCWEDILKLWERCGDDAAFYLLYSAMFHIAWKRHVTAGKSKPLVELVELIEQILLEEGYGYQVWSSSYVFCEAMDGMKRTMRVGGGRCKSEWFSRYIYAKACCKIFLKGREDFEPWKSIPGTDYRILPTAVRAKEIPIVFEGAIRRLVPKSVGWTQREWSNEDFILQEIQRLHGVDYRHDYKSFDNLIDAFDKLLGGRSYDYSLMMVQQLSPSMVPCIWTRGHERSLELFFDRICKQVEKETGPMSNGKNKYNRKNLGNSWVVKQYASGCWVMPQQWKKLIFDVSMGVGC